MAIGYKEQTGTSVQTPVSGEQWTFIDQVDGKLKRKDSTGTIVDIESVAGGVSSFEGRNGAVVSVAGDYTASEITNVPAGDIVATNIQAAINELDTEKAPLTHVGSNGVSEHAVADGSTAGFMSPSDFTKLAGVATGATANSSDAFLLARANHTGTQLAATISDFNTAASAAAPVQSVAGQTGAVLLTKVDVGLSSVDDTADTAKPVSVAQAAADTAVQNFAIQRANHTGSQVASTVSDFSTAADARITLQKAAANGLATLDGSSKIPLSQIPSSLLGAAIYQGTWDASTNSPALASGIGSKGFYYVVNVAGSTGLDGITDWKIGDWAIFNGAVWEKVDNTDQVVSVNGFQGIVVLAKADVGLSNVDNTSDVNKPVSTAQAAADTAVQAFSIQRTNHTGTQIASTVSDFTTAAQTAAVQNSLAASTVIAPSATAVNTGLALKVDRAGDTMTGNLNLPALLTTNTTGGGFVEFVPQSPIPATPAAGFRMYSGSTGRLAFKGTAGIPWSIDYAGITTIRTYTLPDQSMTFMGDPMTTNGDMINRVGGAAARLPVGLENQVLKINSGITQEWDYVRTMFGSREDGNLTLSGLLTLNQNFYYDTITMQAGGIIDLAGYFLYCKVLNLSAADANSIRRNGNNGSSATTQAGASGGGGLTTNTLGGSGGGGNGATGVVGAGAQAAAPTAQTPANGGDGANGAAGGAGLAGANAGGASRSGANTSNFVKFGRNETAFLRGGTVIVGGAGGAGGSSGGGDGVALGRGGGGGGGAGGMCAIFAEEIITGGSTPAGVIKAMGGNGGNGASAASGTGPGGGGGAGGGGGGYIYIAYLKKTGAAVTDLIDASGGNGGNGGNGFGTGAGAAGGNGALGGRIRIYNAASSMATLISGSAGSAGSAGSGVTGGAGGTGGLCRGTL